MENVASHDPAARFFIPTREWIENLQTGDMAPNAFGNLRNVTDVRYRGVDVNGRAYVGVIVEFGDDGRISASFKEDELHRSISIGRDHTSWELTDIEKAGVPA